MKSCMMGTLLGANCRKSMELERFICHGMIDLWLWIYGVYGVGVGWFMGPGSVQLGANCKSNLLIGDLHYCCWLCLGAGLQLDLSPSLLQHFAALHWTSGHLLCLSSLSSRKKTIFWNILWNMSGSVKLTNGKAFTGNIFKLSNLHSKRQDGRKYIHIYLML